MPMAGYGSGWWWRRGARRSSSSWMRTGRCYKRCRIPEVGTELQRSDEVDAGCGEDLGGGRAVRRDPKNVATVGIDHGAVAGKIEGARALSDRLGLGGAGRTAHQEPGMRCLDRIRCGA